MKSNELVSFGNELLAAKYIGKLHKGVGMFKQVTMINVSDWDTLVWKTYGRVYSFQQQDGCKERGMEEITVPMQHPWDYENDTIPEKVNGDEMGVSFKAWLERDPKQKLNSEDEWVPDRSDAWGLSLFWERNFYPSVDMIANDLHAKGLLPAGKYAINIDW